MKYKELETQRLVLRKFHKKDLEFIYNHFRDSFVSKYLYDNEPPKNKSEAKEILEWCIDIQFSNHIRWCIIHKEYQIPIGTIGFHRYDKQNNSSEIGFDLSEKFVRKGIMSEALKCIVNFGFTEYGFHRIYASVAVDNEASNRLLKKNDFLHEGVIRDQYLYQGKYYDHNLWSRIHSEKRTLNNQR